MCVLENAAPGTLYTPSLCVHILHRRWTRYAFAYGPSSLVAIAWHSIPDQVVQLGNFLTPLFVESAEIDTIGCNSMQFAERPR
jgi:hypothetical protein